MLVICLLSGLILGVCCYKGRIHDFALYKKSRWAIKLAIKILADLGFLGLDKRHQNTVLPFKKSKLRLLTKQEKQANRTQARDRVACENRNRECKIFRIVKEVYRGKHKNYGLNWNLIAGMVNFKRATRNLNFATP